MRFAYIDSNGNEVPIPSVDALALRIELGAINESTELYDAQADQWGPAHSHEIFHTLSRVAEEGDQGFVAPLPPLPPPPEPAAPAIVAAEEATAPKAAPPEKPPADVEVEEPAAAVAAEEPVEEHDAVMDLSLAGGFDGPPPAEEPAADDDGPAFDFGDLGGGLEMEAEGAGVTGEEEPAMSFGMELEQGMAFSPADEPMDLSSGTLDLERPMSEFDAESPPAWMEPGESSPNEDVMDFSSIPAEPLVPAAEAKGARAAARAPRDRPSRPKFRRQRSLVAPIVGVVSLGVVGVGGYVAWPIVSAQLASRGPPASTAVVMPPIPEELLPQMQSIAGIALAEAFRSARAGVSTGIPSPPRSWLAGAYLANASQYPEVETFWLGVEDEVAAIRSIDLDTFHSAYQSGMAAEGVPAEDRALLAARADSGFVSATRARADVFALVDELVDAAIGLHEFLVANEDNIQHTPATTGTSDPVLEARPATAAIGDALEVRIDRVTEALDQLDYLDLVTGDGLWRAVLRRVQEVGIH